MTEDESYLRNCNYDPQTDHLCPIFKLGKIVELADVNFEDIAFKVCLVDVIGEFVEWGLLLKVKNKVQVTDSLCIDQPWFQIREKNFTSSFGFCMCILLWVPFHVKL